MAVRFLKNQMQAAGAAFQLITRIPIPVMIPFVPQVLARSVIYYPVVGTIVGGFAAAAGWLLFGHLPAMPSAVIVLMLWAALSGALHLDGLMDTADGVLSHRSRDRMLEIMKDSRVGAMGVIVAVILLLFKFSLLASLLEGESWLGAALQIIAACGWSRLWLVWAMIIWPFARTGEGMASMFAEVRVRHAIAATLLQVVLIFGVGLAFGSSWSSIMSLMLIQAGVTLVIGGIISHWLYRKLGGLTGDTYGALNELIESALLFATLCELMWLN
ncbi:adenosylcobinamide-GDP ribazoletransferase [Paenibacillus baekrokdamisoli]|uniref:Adenosylcobinamide-GDP ribazoletransferase n=1 Tax=Paenibacillus baekrokdamisoli TaxID=1712516 RepID=A0A3G9ILZ1_9BACL|nr:adenosylcobinamide-GDP ribazoletransferase [Paenibacillus baekrokdamisoli]MBB3070616.1 cobalamin 5'-phosphate synthase/cobalamin synthase [Paenibacillus baekrokdamisoli]BBH19967.1 adenosylcobinamide-GDP ribazoletransferase [Paenibacillus baekrokdamisoli]